MGNTNCVLPSQEVLCSTSHAIRHDNGDHFPLFRLPPDALSGVLGSMEIVELILFSALSKRSESYVEALNIKLENPLVTVDRATVNLTFVLPKAEFLSVDFHNQLKSNVLANVRRAQRATVTNYDEGGLRRIAPLGNPCVQMWMDRLKRLFRFTSVQRLIFWDDHEFTDIQSIRSDFPNFETLVISIHVSVEYEAHILETFMPVRSLMLEKRAIQDHVRCQNFDILHIRELRPSSLKLDDVLLLNAKNAIISTARITEKDANKLLKLWIRGAHPRWEMVRLEFTRGDPINRHLVLTGIQYHEASADRVQYFKSLNNDVSHLVNGGFDIWRRDGIRATVELKLNERSLTLRVWYPQCIGSQP